MNVAPYLSHIINDLEHRLDLAEELGKTTLGNRVGSIAFQIWQAAPFIYAGIELSGTINQPYVDVAMKIFVIFKIIKNQSSEPLITPQADRLICNLVAARVLFPYILEETFYGRLAIDTAPYVKQCISMYQTSMPCIKEFTSNQCQQYFDILKSGTFSTIEQCATIYNAFIKDTPYFEKIAPTDCQQYFDTINSIILSTSKNCSSLYTAFISNTSCIGAAALRQCQENFYTLNLNKAIRIGATSLKYCQERFYMLNTTIHIEKLSVAGIISWIGQKISG